MVSSFLNLADLLSGISDFPYLDDVRELFNFIHAKRMRVRIFYRA